MSAEGAPTLDAPSDLPASERRTTPIEMFWDLVFVFAVTQVTTLLRADLTWAGFGRAMLALALVWWAWSGFVWATNAQDPNLAVFRAVMLLSTALIFVAGLALPQAFGRDGTLFAVTYTAVRLLHLALYIDASRRGRASFAAIAGFAVTVLIGMGLLIGGSFLPGWERIALWTAAAAIDYAGPAWLTRERLRGLQRVAVAHFAERYSLFIIICLGESIIAIGLGASGRSLTGGQLGAVSLTLLITIGLWWTYFDRLASAAEESLSSHPDPVVAAADGYSYMHLAVVAGIVIFAVGARIAVAGAQAPLPLEARLALCGGVALYLTGLTAFRLRLTRQLSYGKPAAALACLLIGLMAGAAPAWVTAGSVTATLGLLLVWEGIAERTHRVARVGVLGPLASGPSNTDG